MGKRKRKVLHIRCRRCGKRAYHVKQKRCAFCGYGQTKRLRRYNWKKQK